MPPASRSFTWHPPAIAGSALYFSLLSWARGLCFIHLCLPPHPSLPHHCIWATWDHTIFLSSFFQLTSAPWCSGTDDKWPTPSSHNELTGKKYHLSGYDIPSRNKPIFTCALSFLQYKVGSIQCRACQVSLADSVLFPGPPLFLSLCKVGNKNTQAGTTLSNWQMEKLRPQVRER